LNGCTAIQDVWEVNKEMDIPFEHIKCSHNCMAKLIRSNILTHMTLDRAVKYLPVLDSKMPRSPVGITPIGVSFGINVHLENRSYGDTSDLIGETTIPGDMSSHRTILFPTSSVYKWSDVLVRGMITCEHVVVLGDGTGGTSLVSAHIWPESNIYPMALLESKNLIPQDLESLSPPMSRYCRNVRTDMLVDLPDDIRRVEFKTRLKEKISSMNGRVRIISDIEGSGGLLGTILTALLDMPEDTELVVKTYLADLSTNYCLLNRIKKLEVIFSPLSNLRYGEVFLRMIVGAGGGKVMRKKLQDVISEGISRLTEISEEARLSCMSQTELSFPGALKTSINISLMKLAGWGGAFPQRILKEENLKLVGYVYQYINTHYHFASSRYRPGDMRTVTPLRADQLTKLYSTFLLVVYGESSEILDEISYMRLIGRRAGIKNRPYFKVKVMSGLARREISDDEIKIGRVLRNHRIKESEVIIERGPIGLPFESGSLLAIETWGYKVPVSSNPGWAEEHLQI
jgi:mRNA capping enzyme